MVSNLFKTGFQVSSTVKVLSETTCKSVPSGGACRKVKATEDGSITTFLSNITEYFISFPTETVTSVLLSGDVILYSFAFRKDENRINEMVRMIMYFMIFMV
jgi:hypothetical protein